jgi:flagellar motor switch protein FliN/FliY
MSMNAAVAQITEQELDVVMDIPVTLSLEVGRAQTNVRGLLQLRAGSIIELSKATSEAFDVFFNGRKVAHGEAVVINQRFGVRMTELIRIGDRQG